MRISKRSIGSNCSSQESPLKPILLKPIYDLLLSSFGPQGWWPTTKDNDSTPTYDKTNHSRDLSEREMTEIIIGAILTQNTAWTNVEKALFELNRSNLVDFHRLSKYSQSSLAKKIRSAGYYNQKSARLISIAKYFVKTYQGKPSLLKSKTTTDLRLELLSLDGVGPETADSIILYSIGKPIFVIDAYTKRIFSRLGLVKKDQPYDEFQSFFHDNLKQDKQVFNEYHALIVELAKRHCRTKPVCDGCPLSAKCEKKIE